MDLDSDLINSGIISDTDLLFLGGTKATFPCGGIRKANIEPCDGRLFDFSFDGEAAFIVPVWDGKPSTPKEYRPNVPLIDLLAFKPSLPNHWWLRTGIATMLGDWVIDGLLLNEPPLWIFRTPLNWIRAECSGVCILDWDSAFYQLPLGCRDIIAEDIGHGEEIESRLTRPIDLRIHIAAETAP